MNGLKRTSVVLWSCLTIIQACVTSQSTQETIPAPVTVMSWNVENLFDTVHDEGKNDWTFLPLEMKDEKIKKACKDSSIKERYYKECISKDWNEVHLKEKMVRIGKVILSQNNGKGADLVFLCEIENMAILERLRREQLQAADYQTAILLEGPDQRGIDCAFLSRLTPDGSPTLHPITLSKVEGASETLENTTRAILQADFKLPGGERLTALAIHFPAGFHPTEHRREALTRLNEVAREAAKKSHIVMAAGDFNINYKEADELYKNTAAKDWLISHLEGCKSCPGTYYFDTDDHWSFFDAIMVYRSGQPGTNHVWKMDTDSIKVVNENFFQKNKIGHPLRLHFNKQGEARGVSDHFPVSMQIKAEAVPKTLP